MRLILPISTMLATAPSMASLVLHSRLGALELPQRSGTPLVKEAPFLGQAEFSRGTLKEPHAEPALETLDVLAHRNRRHTKLFCGARKAARRNGSHESDHSANALDAGHDCKP